ncbi:MAG: hypothetical protein IPJ65_37650 [Archangiaceae bacterium]|nr:hypothetical protein [Archangiaceae bacterium]
MKTQPASAVTISRERLARFAPPGVDALELPEQVTGADLDAALARVATAQTGFSDPDALTQFLRTQQSALAARETALASPPPAGETEVVSDVAPKRKSSAAAKPTAEAVSPELAAVPAAQRVVFTKAGLDGAQIVEAAALGVDPRSLLTLMKAPEKPRDFGSSGRSPAPKNTPSDVLAALKSGVSMPELLEYHAIWVPAVEAPVAKAAGFTPETLEPFAKAGADTARAIVLEKAGVEGDEVHFVTHYDLSIETVLECKKVGFDLYELSQLVGRKGNTPEAVLDVWKRYDHRLLDGTLKSAWHYTAKDLARMVDAEAIDFRRPSDEIDKELDIFFKLRVSVDDIIKVAQAGGTAENLSWAVHGDVSFDDYLKLARGGVTGELTRLVNEDRTPEDVIRLVATGKDASFIGRASHWGFDVEQTIALAEAGVEPSDAVSRYVDAGLSREQAIRVIRAGG